MPRKTATLATLITGAAALAAAAAFAASRNQDSTPEGCTHLGAYAAAKAEAADRLASPGTASFPPPPASGHVSRDVILANKGGCLFGVSAWVDSQNGFGAIRRTRFSADMEHRAGRWHLENMAMAPQ